MGGGGGESRAANSDRGLVLGVGGLGKLDRGLGHGETFFPDSDSDRDSDEPFQISRKLSLVHVEFFCLLDSQPWFDESGVGDLGFLPLDPGSGMEKFGSGINIPDPQH